ncbi:MAG TPA: peptidase E [Solirubrobacteraceae bacterium]|jgi:dipeptidase E|nr:peptidase E [Solirubrobacteraceae bacterium]
MSPPEAPPDQRLIFAMGGGGFTMEPSNPLLDDFVLSLASARAHPDASDAADAIPDGAPAAPTAGGSRASASAREPRILFLPTASGDTAAQIAAFHARFADRHCVAEHLSLFRLHELRRPLGEIVLSQDVLYVGGGSMRNLLAIWRAHDLDRLLICAWRRGIVLAGISAGAMCWFAGGITRSSGPPEPLAGLGLLEGSLTVHADGEPERLPVWLAAIRDGALPGGWSLDDGVGLLFAGARLRRVVSSRPGASAQRVDQVAGELVRHRLQPELLGASAAPQLHSSLDEDVQELRRVQRLRRTISGPRGGRLGGY